MSHADLLAPLAAAVRDVGDRLAAAPRPAVAATFEQLKENFEELEAPLAAELRTRLTRLRPGVPWADEFGTGEPPASGEVWVVDVIDGAVQFLRGLPHFCVSVALVRDGEPVAAALYAPLLGETYLAAAGHGATRDGRPVTPSATTDLAAAVVATGQPPFPARQPGTARAAGASLTAVLPAVAAVRNLGPTSWQIADTAAGRLDAFWLHGHDAANLLPGALVAREAGALVTDLTGHPWHPGAAGFLTAPPTVHGGLLPLLSPPARG
ncbi:inositol monophosphatase family protein [Streptantibioticus cattleyicolor]|uniref:Inositol-phosphate phosphatase n=1 Tax=Streptantibioticus cattleyicolor (strain ATCC 35852 / DSM 46488 / JCM 4925 / NBRC 14057 / NRRL 8057) TaxID=1003195 RepID=F8JNF9_STREN|nr:inositol monophosphatase [Streptantibioticus cattleyicolor]AEW99073.1 Inositol-phosphate phosphatase [Streptantibioticus cattleyicolor NRRL 8057 = DSM 46488]CCB71879.1 Inositol monophosphatase/fructose-1, 6-bisphosphatase family protein [Streptantibioticus cattleyicolor NRRL 8057 = DSM 46488]